MAAHKLYYFDFPGRAEVARLTLTYAGVPFEDARLTREEWGELKPKTPFGQLPVLEVDGEMIAQSAAIDRYAAAKAGLLPSDPLDSLKAEAWYFLLEDINKLFYATFSLKTTEEKIAARTPIVEGPFSEKLGKLDKHLEGKAYLLGDNMCYVDLAIFAACCMWRSGFMDGIPTDYLDKFPTLKAYVSKIASLDPVKAMYADKEGPIYTAFKP